MQFKVNEQLREVKFTFNSFKYMENFKLSDLAEVENAPFKMIDIISSLLYGGLNWNPKEKIRFDDIMEYLEDYVEENSIVELLEQLMLELENSSFFKSLQKEAEKQPTPLEKPKKK